jgi:hypothetical protein
MRPRTRLLLISAFLAAASAPLLALEAKVGEIRVSATVVRAALELKGVFKPNYREVIDEGGTLYVRVEAELWEDRAAWDRLVSPARVSVFRVRRDRPARRVTVIDGAGLLTPYADYPDPLGVTLEVAPAERIADDGHYYVHALATVGNSLALESRDVGDVVFGRDEDASGLAAVGKFIFRKAQQISEYLQSVTADVTSRKVTGRQIRMTAGRH